MFTISAAHCWKPSRRTCQAKRRVGAPSLGTLNSRNGAKQQIVSPGGEPIPRLYAAGELGSRFGHLLAGLQPFRPAAVSGACMELDQDINPIQRIAISVAKQPGALRNSVVLTGRFSLLGVAGG